MSIEVTCACAMTYRLPDRYAGKRCRCRECGGPIEVPTDGETRRKAKAKRTTRRLGSQDHEIMSEHRTLRAGKSRPVSESMHQLSPIDMSRALEAPEAIAPRKPRRAKAAEAQGRANRKTRRTKSREERDEREAREERARDRRDRVRDRRERDGSDARDESRSDERPVRRKKKNKKAAERRARDEDHEGGRKGKKGKAAGAEKPKGKKASRLELEAKPGKRGSGAALPARSRPGTRSGARRREEEEEEEREVGRRRDPVMAAVVIAAILCLAVGLIIGVALQGGGGGGEELQQKLAKAQESVTALKGKREWEAAKTSLSTLLPELDQAGMAAEASRVREELRLLDTLAKLTAIEDEEERLATLLQYASNKDVAVRQGVTHELRSLSEQPEAQEALANLAKDQDPRVAETARQGLIAAGGPHAIPYLAQAIADSAATGGKQGEVALQRAMEIDDPRVVAVLIKAIEVRPNASKGVLLPILQKLQDLGEPSAKAAVKKLTSHADPAVKEKAEKVLEDLGG